MKVLLLDFYHFLKSTTLVLALFINFTLVGQNNFKLSNGANTDKIKFELANNLIVIPVVLNGVELSFILDTGVGSTIIFSVDNRSSLELKNASKIYLRGLGDGEPVEAIKSLSNEVKIGNAVSSNHTVYLVFDESINFSPRMGFPIHGIIGYDFFKNFVLDINYTKGVIKINKPRSYVYKKCKKCYQTEIAFRDQNKRPYVTAKYKSLKGLIDINLLLDSGSGSSLWLFENAEKGINIPKNSFRDFLGKGFNGDIYGQRTKIEELHVGDFVLRDVTTSFPDSVYIRGIPIHKRQGSLGGNVLKRFNLIVDYPNRKISFKKNSFFSKPFHYNMSGITVQHTGFDIAVDTTAFGGSKRYNEKSRQYLGLNKIVNEKTVTLSNGFILRPKYEISDIRPDSPADISGLRPGDVIIEVNGKKAYNYKLSELNDLFYSEEGKKIRIKVNRLGVEIKYEFYLKKVI
ncbi:pepsin/retropepsin-like aspartic protease family protein [Aquimarina mytili]|uniref:Aspartyl protease family protein n=1 Tax=Aquimarina mytili TaxID=874423 RepID=A0A937D979_9FLAO|nr:aspartyl protease family protein [Aquimarina mytili]MBL0684805.1 aspartyl protease family protein [Aquimarina mytili]